MTKHRRWSLESWKNQATVTYYGTFNQSMKLLFWFGHGAGIRFYALWGKASSTSVHKCRMRHAKMREMLMLMWSQGDAQTAFVCAANITWTAEHYLFGVTTSEKNTFAMLRCLTMWMPNKPLSGISSDLPQSRMPHSHTDVDIP